jgi:hypothetical protein
MPEPVSARKDPHSQRFPGLVVCQDGPNSLRFFLLKSKLAYLVTGRSPNWEWFEPHAVNYLYEQGASEMEPPYLGLRDIKLIAIDPCLYKEFSKRADLETLYFPPYSKEELAVVGAYIKGSYSEDSFISRNFSAGDIESRFDRYGSVIQRVLPTSEKLLLQNEINLRTAMSETNLENMEYLLTADSIDGLGSYLVQWSSGSYVSAYGTFPFRTHDPYFISDEVIRRIGTAIGVLTYEQLTRKILLQGTADRCQSKAAGMLQEMLFRRFVMEHHKYNSIGGIRGIVSLDYHRKYAEMAMGTLYTFDGKEHACDAFYKDLDGKLVLLQCAWVGDSVCKGGAFVKFLSDIEFEGNPSDLRVVCARGNESVMWRLDFTSVHSRAWFVAVCGDGAAWG